MPSASTSAILVTGSIVGTHHDLEEVFQLHQLRRTRVPHETRRLEQVNFLEVEHGTAKAPRLVLNSKERPYL
jgi:propanol-preferring alcohol dehydrogenase